MSRRERAIHDEKKKRASDIEVAEYWLTHDSADEVDWKRAGSGWSSTPTSNVRRDR